MAEFRIAYRVVVDLGTSGYVKAGDDNGGEIYKGISRADNPEWMGWRMIDGHSKRNIAMILDSDIVVQDLVKKFYRETYWDKLLGDHIRHQEVATELFDIAINISFEASCKFIQRAVNLLGSGSASWDDIKVDGRYTMELIEIINRMKCVALLKCLNAFEYERYERMCREANDRRKQMNLWLTRV